MPTRAETLAAQFEAATQEAIQAVQGCTETIWRTPTPNDGRTVGVLAHHIATGDVGIGGLVGAIANGQPMPPITPEMIDQGNAQHAQQFANVTKEEAVQALQQNGREAAALVRGLSDAQLDNKASFLDTEWTTELAIQRILIGHVQDHLGTIRATA